MENKTRQAIFLNNSVYLKNLLNQSQEFNKTQQIMQEQSLTSYMPINDPLRIKSINSKMLFQSQYCQTNQYTSQKLQKRHINSENYETYRARQKIPRLCAMNFPKTLQEFNTKDILSDQKWRKKRDFFAAKAKIRKENAFKTLRERVHEILVFQLTEQTQSQIQNQTFEQQELKEMKVENFLLRQQFANKQKDVLRQMKEFCLYGTIKLQ